MLRVELDSIAYSPSIPVDVNCTPESWSNCRAVCVWHPQSSDDSVSRGCRSDSLDRFFRVRASNGHLLLSVSGAVFTTKAFHIVALISGAASVLTAGALAIMPPPVEMATSNLVAAVDAIDVGEVGLGKPISLKFALKNVSRVHSVEIATIDKDCGCTTTDVRKQNTKYWSRMRLGRRYYSRDAREVSPEYIYFLQLSRRNPFTSIVCSRVCRRRV